MRRRLKLPAYRLFAQPLIQAQIKENIKAPRHWLLRGEFTGDLNSLHKEPVTRKMFPFDDVIMDGWNVRLELEQYLNVPVSNYMLDID